jgi:hypothetical protein
VKRYICAFPTPSNLSLISSLGFDGVRFDVLNSEQLPAIGNFASHPSLTPLAIINDYYMCIPVAEAIARLGRGAIELVNEPDLNRWTPGGWAEFTKACYPAIKVEQLSHHGHKTPIPVVSGGISNLNHKQLNYLTEAQRAGLLCDIIGFHRYKTESAPPIPLTDYHDRKGEFFALKATVEGRPIWCTEEGWHTAQQGHGVKLSEEQVASYAIQEQAIQEEGGAEVMTWFVLDDGPTADYNDHFGIRRIDGTLKPAAHVWNGGH